MRPHAIVRINTLLLTLGVSLLLTLAVGHVPSAEAVGQHPRLRVTELATFVDGPCTDDICGSGSTVGPDGNLYVTDSSRGRIQRIDPRRGTVTTYADGLPLQLAGVIGGGVGDIAFLDGTPYVLVAGVNEFWTDLVGSANPPAAEGIYRLDRVGAGRTRATLVADLYSWSEAHPPRSSSYFIPGGFTYAMERYGDGFLVTDAHHNRVLQVRRDGRIGVFLDFGANIVPTGLELSRSAVLVAQAGPVPHLPETGRVIAIQGQHDRRRPSPAVVASGAPLLVDVELDRRHLVLGLSQGNWPYEGQEGKEGYPAAPDTGQLMIADRHGEFRSLVTGLDRPTTFELIDDAAYVVTITGKVLRVSGLR